jgi:hypothetical protein
MDVSFSGLQNFNHDLVSAVEIHNLVDLKVLFPMFESEAGYIDGHPFERSLNNVLMHLAPIPGSGAMTCCAGRHYLKAVVLLLDLIQSLVDTQVTS